MMNRSSAKIVQLFQQNEEMQNEKNIEKDIISYDGKVCNSSNRKKSKTGTQKPVNAMSAFNVTKDIRLCDITTLKKKLKQH